MLTVKMWNTFLEWMLGLGTTAQKAQTLFATTTFKIRALATRLFNYNPAIVVLRVINLGDRTRIFGLLHVRDLSLFCHVFARFKIKFSKL